MNSLVDFLQSNMKDFYLFLRLIIEQRFLILAMAKRELKNQYIGSMLGFVWTFIQPIVMIGIFWMVFGVGFKAQPLGGVPFAVWLTAGMACWFFFSDIVSGSTGVIISHRNLIKKTPLQSHILPVVKIFSSLVTHTIFLLLLIGLILFHRLPLSFYYFQLLYYLFGACMLGLGLGWLTAALNPFLRDVGQIVNVILQVLMWATPVMWDLSIMPKSMQPIFKMNPVYYLVQGYRESFLYFVPFWRHPKLTVSFWLTTGVLFIIGGLVFKKLKPHFADVL